MFYFGTFLAHSISLGSYFHLISCSIIFSFNLFHISPFYIVYFTCSPTSLIWFETGCGVSDLIKYPELIFMFEFSALHFFYPKGFLTSGESSAYLVFVHFYHH